MNQTLFHIPEKLVGLPVFGFGWLLIVWLLGCAGYLAWQVQRGGWRPQLTAQLPLMALIAGAIAFLLPWVQSQLGEGGSGLPIRGFGVMLLLGVAAGLALAVWRARQMGIEADAIFSLTFWMFLTAVIGARLFFIIEYWELFQRPTWGETLSEILKVTQGGIVLYGAFLGGLLGFAAFCARNKLPALAMADLIAPALVIGLAFGRLGCLMNGCCFGGLCEEPWAISFPRVGDSLGETPPYAHQHGFGLLHGFRLQEAENGELMVGQVLPGSAAEVAGLQAGTVIERIELLPRTAIDAALAVPQLAGAELKIERRGKPAVTLTVPPYKPISGFLDSRRLGLTLGGGTLEPTVREVYPDSPAAAAGLAVDDVLLSVELPPPSSLEAARGLLQFTEESIALETNAGRFDVSLPAMPSASLPVHPTQIYSSINALLLTLVLWFFYPYRPRDGAVFALMLTLYPIARFTLEMIRSDEPGMFAGLTVSQNLSLVLLAAAAVLWIFILSRPKSLALPWRAPNSAAA